MARKVVSRKEKRAEAEAATKTSGKKKKVVKKKKAAKKAAPRRSKSTEVRLKLFWGVFNQSLKRVALYEFNQRKQAEKKAAELSKSAKTPHFVQRVKEEISE